MVFKTCKAEGEVDWRCALMIVLGMECCCTGQAFLLPSENLGSRGHSACSPCFAQYQRRDISNYLFSPPDLAEGNLVLVTRLGATYLVMESLLHRPRLPAVRQLCSAPQGQPSWCRPYFSSPINRTVDRWLARRAGRDPFQAPEDNICPGAYSRDRRWGIIIIIQINTD
jgi:hypothetical protein